MRELRTVSLPLERLPALLLPVALLLGCATTPGPEAPADRRPAGAAAPAAPAPLTPEQRAIEVLLREADRALAENRLTTPVEDNALDRLLHVLVLAPGEPRARAGIEEIARRYQRWALTAAGNGDETEARRLIDLARQVRPDDPTLATTERAMQRALAPPAERLTLDPTALNVRDAELGARLARLGTRAKEEALFVIITTPRDAWSRWIYQQMNAAPPARRLRARSEVGPVASVVLRAVGG
jgi:hypothetical protein